MRIPLFGFIFPLLAGPMFAAAPALVPLPQQMQVRTGLFTLCSSQPIPGAPAFALTKILVDTNSQENGEYLAALLFKSTGYKFQIATNSGVSTVKHAILLTTANAMPTLGPEGYELTVAPD